MAIAQGLWTLFLGIVVFVLCYAGFVSLCTPVFNQAANYHAAHPPTSFSGDINLYNQSQSFTLPWSINPTSLTVNGHSLEIALWPSVTNPLQIIGINHVAKLGPLYLWAHSLTWDGGENKLSIINLFSHIDNTTASSRIKCSCDHLTLAFIFQSSNSSYTLQQCIWDLHSLNVTINYGIDYSAMSGNIFSIMTGIFTFSTIQTGETTMDILLNFMISTPVVAAIAYIIWRFVTGSIPTLSGGGGS